MIGETGQSPHEEPCSWHDITLSFYFDCACAYKYIKSYGMLALECFGAKPSESEKQAGDMEGAVQAYEEALGIHEPPDATLSRGFSFGACHKSFRADLESARAKIPAKIRASQSRRLQTLESPEGATPPSHVRSSVEVSLTYELQGTKYFTIECKALTPKPQLMEEVAVQLWCRMPAAF